MGTLDNIARAKAEILDGARVAILNVDEPRLAAIADRATNPEVWRVGTEGQSGLDVSVAAQAGDAYEVSWRGAPVGTFVRPQGIHAGNVACAVAAVLAVGLTPAQVGAGLGRLAPPDHRASAVESQDGIMVIDDTFNSNPSGARAALDRLVREPSTGGRAVVVTPGMVELGAEQDKENEAFARAVVDAGAHLVVVGWTNRVALVAGGGGEVTTVADREAARRWIRGNLGAGDRVLWENDLPDQYP
jgi:UDP-N-acetylmuramoyl-tripeptide--D-alanyl-D-alanine ligase